MIKQIIFKQPIADNTIRAILKNGSGVARMVVKPRPSPLCPYCHQEYDDMWYWTSRDGDDDMMDWWPSYESGVKPPYRPGDILYVRETWRVLKAHRYDADAYIEFKAGGNGTVLRFPHGCTDSINRDNYDHFIEKWGVGGKWRPSIQMPREAARIFLRVKEVRAERLKDITDAGIRKEGLGRSDVIYYLGALRCDFAELWDRTVKPSDIALYGWDANPWVFVIEFERISKEECHESP